MQVLPIPAICRETIHLTDNKCTRLYGKQIWSDHGLHFELHRRPRLQYGTWPAQIYQ